MELEKMIEGSMKYEILLRWSEQFDEAVWKKRAFGDYTDDEGIAKIAVADAAERVAEDFGSHIPEDDRKKLQQRVNLKKNPEAIFPAMIEAVGFSVPRPPADKLAKALRKEIEAMWPEKAEEVWYWRAIPFREYDENVELESVQALVLRATDQVLNEIEKQLPDPVRNNLKNQITLDTRPQAAIRFMKEAVQQAV